MSKEAENFLRLFFASKENRELALTIYPGLDENVREEIRKKAPGIVKYLKDTKALWQVGCGYCRYKEAHTTIWDESFQVLSITEGGCEKGITPNSPGVGCRRFRFDSLLRLLMLWIGVCMVG